MVAVKEIVMTLVAIAVGWMLYPVVRSFVEGANLTGPNGEDFTWASTLVLVLYLLAITLIPVGILIRTVGKSS